MCVGFGLVTAMRAIESQSKLCLLYVTRNGVKVEGEGNDEVQHTLELETTESVSCYRSLVDGGT